MKKIKSRPRLRYVVGSIAVLVAITIGPMAAFAQVSTAPQTSTSQTALGNNQVAKIANIKSRADTEIDKRLASLNAAATRINAAKKLTTADKSNFSAQIQTDISNLTTLKTKIDADTDLATLRTDAKTIFADFRVYAVFLPQIHLLSAVDTMGVTADNLTAIATKLQTRIQTDQGKGKDVSQLQAWLADMQSKIADAKSLYIAVEAEVSPLTPAGYPGATATLKDARTKIKTGAADLRAAWQDARQIVGALKALNGDTGTGKPSSQSATTK